MGSTIPLPLRNHPGCGAVPGPIGGTREGAEMYPGRGRRDQGVEPEGSDGIVTVVAPAGNSKRLDGGWLEYFFNSK